MTEPTGFEYTKRRNGDVIIKANGRKATILRGERAKKFLSRVEKRDPQEVMARMTGNYKRGNEDH